MAKVLIEFNEEKDLIDDINAAVNRSKLVYALTKVNDIYRSLINGKIYDNEALVFVKEDGCIATEEDYKKVRETGKLLKGKYYLNQEWVEQQLENILEDVKEYLN